MSTGTHKTRRGYWRPGAGIMSSCGCLLWIVLGTELQSSSGRAAVLPTDTSFQLTTKFLEKLSPNIGETYEGMKPEPSPI